LFEGAQVENVRIVLGTLVAELACRLVGKLTGKLGCKLVGKLGSKLMGRR